MRLNPDEETAATLLSSKKDFGWVMRCPNGCIHISIGNLTFRLSEAHYWTLMEMLSESATEIANHSSPPVDQNVH